jgi:hypothetical protein
MSGAREIKWADDPGDDVEAGVTNATEFTFTFSPGPVGMTFSDGGVIQVVPPGGQAALQGVQHGWTIVRVGGQDVEGQSMQAILSAISAEKASGEEFTLSFVAPGDTSDEDSREDSEEAEQRANLLGKASDTREMDVEMQPLTGVNGVLPKVSVYEKPLHVVWPGKNWFFFGGFLITGGTDDYCCPNICVWSFILVPSTFYFFWVFPALWLKGVYALPALTLIIFFITTGSLIATCCSDPGIIPRREVVLATRDGPRLEAAMGYNPLGVSDGKEGDSRVPENLSGQGYRWCRTCRVIRPPRSSHCPDCDNCVLRYDHHCPFVNNCVGQRNYHFFFGFVTCVWCLALLVLPAILWYMTSRDIDATIDSMVKMERRRGAFTVVSYTLIVLGIIVLLAALASMGLWFYHVFLIATNQTTKEFRRSIDNITEEPTLCASRGPRLFDPWAMVNPHDMLPQLPSEEKPYRKKGRR